MKFESLSLGLAPSVHIFTNLTYLGLFGSFLFYQFWVIQAGLQFSHHTPVDCCPVTWGLARQVGNNITISPSTCH